MTSNKLRSRPKRFIGVANNDYYDLKIEQKALEQYRAATKEGRVNDNLAIVKRFITEFLGRGDTAAADATAAVHIRGITGLKPSGPIEGLAEYKETIRGFVDAFPAVGTLTILDQFASADGTRVVTRFQSRQKHAKAYYGLAATNRTLLFDETHVARLEGGRIVENIVSATNLEFEMLMAPILTPMILK